MYVLWISLSHSNHLEIIDESPSEQWNALLQSEANLDDLSNSENEEDIENVRRANTFLRFGRAMSPNSATFLRFGRQMSPTSGSFLRFGRSNLPSTLLGRGGHQGAAFLRFGRRAANLPSSNFHRFARKGEFLRFG